MFRNRKNKPAPTFEVKRYILLFDRRKEAM